MAMNPPKLRDWKRGTYQVGVFLRTPQGGVVELVNDQAEPAEVQLVTLLLCGGAFSDAFKEQLAAEVARLTTTTAKSDPEPASESTSCTCGHAIEEHAPTAEYPGSTACATCDCVAFEASDG